jgi:3-methyladenine DNA glycosylase AlkD
MVSLQSRHRQPGFRVLGVWRILYRSRSTRAALPPGEIDDAQVPAGLTLKVAARVEAFGAALAAAGSPVRAMSQKAYLKSDLEFFGTDLPTIHAMARAFKRASRDLSRGDLLDLVGALWQTRQHELHLTGIGLLDLYRDRLLADDIGFVERLLRRSKTWAYVDWLSTKVAGSIVERYPESRTVLRRWAVDENFWVRRASLLALHDALRAGQGDWDLFVELASPMVEEREFFIRKAIGWILREVSKKRPELSYAFLKEHIDRVSGITLREGVKYLPPDQRVELMQAFQTKPMSVRNTSSSQ